MWMLVLNTKIRSDSPIARPCRVNISIAAKKKSSESHSAVFATTMLNLQNQSSGGMVAK